MSDVIFSVIFHVNVFVCFIHFILYAVERQQSLVWNSTFYAKGIGKIKKIHFLYCLSIISVSKSWVSCGDIECSLLKH